MFSYVIDASVVFKWFVADSEAGFNEAREILKRLKDGELALFAPNFLLLEVANIFYWKRKFALDDVENCLGKLINSGINFSDCPARNTQEVFQLMAKYEITAYDAIYLWLAKDKGLKLISADEKLLEIKDYVFSLQEAVSPMIRRIENEK